MRPCPTRRLRHALATRPSDARWGDARWGDARWGNARLGNDCRGVAALELAIVMPVLLIMLLGGVQVEQLVRLQTNLTEAATTMAELAATQPSTAQPSLTDDCIGSRLLLTPFAGTQLRIAVARVTRSSTGGSVAVNWQDTSCGNATAIADPGATAAPLVPSAGDSAVVAVATYTYAAPLAFLLPTTITLSETGYARPRLTSTPSAGTGSSGGQGSSGGGQ
jgi:Flp pilus assembly protein TadG